MKKFTNFKSNDPFKLTRGLIRNCCKFKFKPAIACHDTNRDTTTITAEYKIDLGRLLDICDHFSWKSIDDALLKFNKYGETHYTTLTHFSYDTFIIETNVLRNPEDRNDYEEAERMAVRKSDKIALKVLHSAISNSIYQKSSSIDLLKTFDEFVMKRLEKYDQPK